MHPDDEKRYALALLIVLPVMSWLITVNGTRNLPSPKFRALAGVMRDTPGDPALLGALCGGLLLAIGIILIYRKSENRPFADAPFRRFFRGGRIVTQRELMKLTTAKGAEQITIAGVPVPLDMEDRHFLFPGTTGAGKSVLLREMAYKALLRGDRLIVVDPNGDMYSKFAREVEAPDFCLGGNDLHEHSLDAGRLRPENLAISG